MKKAFFLFILLVTRVEVADAWTIIGSGIQGWATYNLVFHVNPTGCTLSEAELIDLVDRSLRVWNSAPTSSLSVSRAAEYSSVTPAQYLAGTVPDVPIIFCDTDFGTNIGDADAIPGAAVLSPSATIIDRAAIFLNAQDGAGAEISRLNPSQLRVTFAHEMGHVLGLGHTSVPEALMYYNIAGKDDARLSEDDIQGLSFLYPRDEFGRGTFGCSAVHGRGHPLGTFFGALFIFFTWLMGKAISCREKRLSTPKPS